MKNPFKEKPKEKEIDEANLIKLLGMYGKMVGMSKSGYLANNKENLVVFNANVCIKENGKIWFGDIDVTKEQESLEALAIQLDTDIFILREMDARFDNEDKPEFKNFAVKFSPDGTHKAGEFYSKYTLA